MGPKNIALVKLYQADQSLREAQGRLDSASRGVRVQQRKVADLQARVDALQKSVRQQQAKAAELESSVQAFDARLEKLRTQQQSASNNKEYQAFLVEINTQKIDRKKVEDEAMSVLEAVERSSGELAQLRTQLETETQSLQTIQSQITDKLTELQKEVDELKPARDAAAENVPAQMRIVFDRVSERFDGEAMSPLVRTHPRREEYACSACNMALVVDVYNRLHSRDDLVPCPSCGRYLFIPDELPVDQAVNRKKTKPETAKSEASKADEPKADAVPAANAPSDAQAEPGT